VTEPSAPPNYEALGDLFALADPQPMYKAMLEAGGVLRPADGVMIVAQREMVDEVLRHPETFTSRDVVHLGNVRPLIPLGVDPPEHVKYRKILDPLFAPRRMDAIEEDVTARVNLLIDGFIDRGACHFTDEFAVPFPSAVFLGLMGLPWDELDTLLRLKEGIMRPATTDAAERARLQAGTGQEIYEYFDAILDDRSKDPRDDILTQFLSAEVDGDRLSREDMLDICFLFLIAGLDTVTDSLTCFFAHLAQQPDRRRQLVEDPAVIPAVVEELLRWETPVPSVVRQATADGELGGCPYSAGDLVAISLGAANVDPASVPDAFDVRFDRDANRHLGFGGGVHRCLGSHLARRELRITLQEWHRRIPDYRLKPGLELRYPPGLRTVENLELVW
jgi:cytochrome P450